MVFLITQEVLWFFTYILFNFQRTMFSCVLLSQATCLSYHPPKLSVFPYNSIQEDYPLYPPIFTKSRSYPRDDTHGLVFGKSLFNNRKNDQNTPLNTDFRSIILF